LRFPIGPARGGWVGSAPEEHVVRIRMQRFGRTHRPFYRINAIDGRTRRDGRVIESLGWYNPVEQDASKQISLNEERVRDWLSRGAQPSETVLDMLGRFDLLEGKLKARWEADRESAQRRGRCRTAIKSIEAAAKEGDALLADGEVDEEAVKPHVNAIKRSLNDAKRTLHISKADEAERLASKAEEALSAAKSAAGSSKAKAAQAAAAAATEEAPEEGAGEEAASES